MTTKQAAELRRLDRKVMNGKASRKEVGRAIELKRMKGAGHALSK